MKNHKIKYLIFILLPILIFSQKTELKEKNISEVVLTSKTDEKALQIIKKVNELYEVNSPKNLESYYFQSYMKASADLHPDSIEVFKKILDKKNEIIMDYWNKYPEIMKKRQVRLDSIKKAVDDKKSTSEKTKEINLGRKFFEKNAFFVWEKAQEYLYKKGKGEKINILDNKLSGLKNPIYEMMSFQTNINKIPKQIKWENHFDYTYFIYPDEIENGREVFVIRYREKALKDKKSTRFNGYFYIDKLTYAIVKIEHQSNKEGDVSIKSEWKEHFGKWFLDKEDIKYAFGRIDIREPKNPLDSLNRIKTNKPDTVKRKSMLKIREYLTLKHQFSKFESPKQYDDREFKNYSIEVKNSDGKQMQLFRTDSLTKRETSSIKDLDSLGEKADFDKKIGIFQTLLSGQIRYNKFDIDIFNFFNYNQYEGFRTQFGFKGNEMFSKIFSPDVYLAYGFKDSKLKFGLGLDIKTSKYKEEFIRFAYTDDVVGAGDFNQKLWDISNRINNLSTGKRHENYVKYNEFLLRYKTDLTNELSLMVDQSYRKTHSLFDYQYINENKTYIKNSSQITMLYAPGVKNIMTPRGKYKVESARAELFINYEKSWRMLGGEFDFHKLDVFFYYPFSNNFGKAKFTFYGGLLLGNAPIWDQFEAGGLQNMSVNWLQNFSMKSSIGLASLESGQYFHDKFVAQSIEQELPFRWAISGKNTSFSLIYKSMIGENKNNGTQNYSNKTLNNYYQEAGIFWNKAFGNSFTNLGIIYKFGAYHDTNIRNNFGFQMSINLNNFVK